MNKKVQITIDDELLDKVDEFADCMYMSRSGFVSLAVSKMIKEQEVYKAIKSMQTFMSKCNATPNFQQSEAWHNLEATLKIMEDALKQ